MSWIIVEKQTGKAVCELFSENNVKIINTKKYKAIGACQYLYDLNLKINGGMTYRDKRNRNVG